MGGLLFQLGDQLVLLRLFAFEVSQQTEGKVLVQLCEAVDKGIDLSGVLVVFE